MRRALHWVFMDRHTGRIVIAQFPNKLMGTVLLALAVSYLVPSGRSATAISIVLYLALAAWAFDELISGVNPWRRFLGAGTLILLVAWIIVSTR